MIMSSLFPWHIFEKSPHNMGIHCVELRIKLTPKAAHSRIQGIFYDAAAVAFLKVSVTSPPIDGRANEALIELLSNKLKCAKSTLVIVRGQTDRYKVLHVHDHKSEDSAAALRHVQRSLLP